MPKFDYKRVQLESGAKVTVVNVPDGAKVLKDEPATGRNGRPLPTEYPTVPNPGELKGKELDEALDAAGLPKNGTADEKRQRLADHTSADPAAVDPEGGSAGLDA
jgi:hypothetical protein